MKHDDFPVFFRLRGSFGAAQDGDQITLSAEAGRLVVFRRWTATTGQAKEGFEFF